MGLSIAAKKLLYLDQNYLSNMAKAKYNLAVSMSENNKAFYIGMFNAIEQAVANNRLACPGLEYQMVEASFDTRLRDGISWVLSALTLDLNFLPRNSLFFAQVFDAAHEYLQKPLPPLAPWEKIFDADPNTEIQVGIDTASDSRSNLITVYAPLLEQLVEHDRKIKESFKPGVERIMKEHEAASKVTWEEELRTHKISFINNYFGPLALRNIQEMAASSERIREFVGVKNLLEIMRLFEGLTSIFGEVTEQIGKFFVSEQLMSVPFIDIYCSMSAAISYYNPRRTPKNSDFYDVPIMATVLPYCDVVTADGFMRDLLINRLHFDKKYDVQIFGSNRYQEELLLQWIKGQYE